MVLSTSSWAKSMATSGRTASASRTSAGQPPSAIAAAGSAPEPARHRRGLVGREEQVVLRDLDQAVGGPEPRQPHRRGVASGEDEVPVVGQPAQEAIDQVGTRRAGPCLVGVVEHDAHVDRGVGGDGVGDLGGRIVRAVRHAEDRQQRRPEHVAVDVARRAGVPHVDAARLDGVGPHGLGEQRRLPEAGAGLDHRDRVLPAGVEPGEQAGPAHLVGQGHREPGEAGARQALAGATTAESCRVAHRRLLGGRAYDRRRATRPAAQLTVSCALRRELS